MKYGWLRKQMPGEQKERERNGYLDTDWLITGEEKRKTDVSGDSWWRRMKCKEQQPETTDQDQSQTLLIHYMYKSCQLCPLMHIYN